MSDLTYSVFEQTLVDLFELYSLNKFKKDESQSNIIEQKIHKLIKNNPTHYKQFYKEYKDFDRY